MSRVFANVNINQGLCTPNICSIAPTGTISLQNSIVPMPVLPAYPIEVGSTLKPMSSLYVKPRTIYIGDATISSTGTSLVTSPITSNSITLASGSNNVTLVYSDGGIQVTGPTGSAVITGPQGDTGFQGPTGPTGSQGYQGATGLQGSIGAIGPQGPLGPLGNTGAQGSTGPQGPQGSTGPQGPPGSTSNTGAQGAPGPTGVVPITTETLTGDTSINPIADVSFLGSTTFTLSTGTRDGFSKTLINIGNNNAGSVSNQALGTGYSGPGFGTFIDSLSNYYVGGTSNISKFNGSTWTNIGNMSSGTAVFSLAEDSSGRIYGAGIFTSIGGVSITGLARYDGSGWSALPNVPSLNANNLGSPNQILISGNNLYVAYQNGFTTFDISSNTNWTQYSGAFTDNFTYPNFLALDSVNNRLYMNGRTTGSPSSNIGMCYYDFGSSTFTFMNDSSFNAPSTELPYKSRAVVSSSGTVYAFIQTIQNNTPSAGNSTYNSYIKRWNGGTSWTTLGNLGTYINSFANGDVFILNIFNGSLYIGGSFLTIDGLSKSRFASYNLTSGVWSGNNTDFSGAVYSIYSTSTALSVVGAFTNAFGNANSDYITSLVITPPSQINTITGPFSVAGNNLASVQLNAAGSNLQTTWSSSLNKWVVLSYQGATGASGFKTFVIPHPVDDDRYLVHACLEGPEAGIYYRGTGEIKDGKEYCEVELPYYVQKLASNFTVGVCPVYNDKTCTFNTSEFENNNFRVYGEPGKFHWQVYGKRSKIEVEPLKSSVELKGDGPYKWL